MLAERRSGRSATGKSAADPIWREALLVDGGDAFSDMPKMDAERQKNAIATAGFIVKRFAADGMSAQNIGERDLALGRPALEELQRQAPYPFVTTNIVDATTGKPLFSRYVIVEVPRDGATKVKLALFGLVSFRAESNREAEGIRIDPPVDALRAAIAQAKAEGAQMFVVLSQLLARDEAAVAEALPEVQLFLGGEGMTTDAESVGRALSLSGGQKGKQLGFVKITLDDPAGAGAPFFDPHRKSALERKRDEAKRRVEMYQRMVDQANQPPTLGKDGKPTPRAPAEVYQRQLAAARADLQLAEDGLNELGAGPNGQPSGGDRGTNAVTVEMQPLSKEIVDDPAVKALVEEHRKSWPDPTPGGH